jgi:hypothetical protein
MTSQLNVDTIVDKAGSGGTNVKIGNTSTYVSEGGNVSSNVSKSFVKHFATIQGTDTFAGYNSLNMSTATDHGTGDHSTTMTNPFNEARFARNVYPHNTENEGGGAVSGANRAGVHTSGNGSAAPTTTVFRFNTYYGAEDDSDGAVIDLSYNYLIAVGELA